MITYANTALSKSGILFSENGFYVPHEVSFTEDVHVTARFKYDSQVSQYVEERLTNGRFESDTVNAPAIGWSSATDQKVVLVNSVKFMAMTGMALTDRVVRRNERIQVSPGDRLTFSATGLLQEVRGTGAGYVGIEMYDENGALLTIQGTTRTKVLLFTEQTSATKTGTYVVPGNVQEVVYVIGYEKNGQEGNTFRVTNLSLKSKSELRFGISPRFLNPMLHLRAEVQERMDGTFFRIIAMHFGEERLMKQTRISSLTQDTTYELIAKNTGTSYWFYLDGILLGQIEYGDTAGGSFAVQGVRGLLCTDLVVSTEQATEWIYTPAEGGLVYVEGTDEKTLVLKGNALGDVSKVRQAVALTKGAHVFTARMQGEGTIRIGAQTFTVNTQGSDIQFIQPFQAESKTELLTIESSKELRFQDVQIERNEFFTGYIESGLTQGVRDASTFSVPTDNNLEEKEGTLLVTISPNHEMKQAASILKVGEMELLYATDKKFTLKLGAISLVSEARTFDGEETFVISWSNAFVSFYRTGDAAEVTSWTEVPPMRARKMSFTNTPLFEGHVKRLIVWSQGAHPSDLIRTNDTRNRDAVIYDTTFSRVISTKKKNFVESTMAPMDGSPILVKDEQGLMNPTYFFDEESGEYRSYHEQELYYRGEETWELDYTDIDTSFFETTIDTTDGIRFEGFCVEEGIVYFTLSEEERKQWIGKTFVVRYQRDRSYYIDYNKGAIDSYRLYLAQEKGEALEVTQEGNRFSNRRLVKEVDMNPIVNPRHEGFMYITHKDQEAKAFRVEVSSVFLHADGVDSADIVVEAIDEDGVEVLSPYLNIYVIGENQTLPGEMGLVAPIISWDTLKSRNAAGRAYYKYRAPHIPTREGRTIKKAFLVVEDRKTGIGTQVPIFLKPAEKAKEGAPKLPAPGSDTVFEYMARYMDKNRNDVVKENKATTLKAGVINLTTTTNVNTLLPIMRRLQMNTLRINVTVDVPSVTSSTVTVSTSLKTKLSELLDALATEKWNIILAPKVKITTGEPATAWNPSSKSSWETNWINLMKGVFVPYGLSADAAGIVIGKEMSLLESETVRWTNILNTLYPLITGNMIYEMASWSTNVSTQSTIAEYETKLATPWFSHPYLSILSISVNFGLTTKTNPTYSELISTLTSTTVNTNNQNVYEEIKNFNRKHDKPIWFGEFGIAALDGAAVNPFSTSTSTTENLEIQGRYFNAYADRFASDEWWIGQGWYLVDDAASALYPDTAALEASLSSQKIQDLDESLGVKLSFEKQLTKYDVLDIDDNAQIVRSELDWLITAQYDTSAMRTKQMQLLEREDFE